MGARVWTLEAGERGSVSLRTPGADVGDVEVGGWLDLWLDDALVEVPISEAQLRALGDAASGLAMDATRRRAGVRR